MTLYINCCARACSRTDRLARRLLAKLGSFEEIRPQDEGLVPLNEERLAKRSELLAKKCYSDPSLRFARQFAAADNIVISAPYWDLSFPAELKVYIENIYVVGIVSEYAPDGTPHGLCRAKELFYVTTAGGPYNPKFSFDYIKDLAENFFGIGSAKLIAAEFLDIEGNNPEKILAECIERNRL